MLQLQRSIRLSSIIFSSSRQSKLRSPLSSLSCATTVLSAHEPQRKLDWRHSRIADNYNSLDEVTEALARAGLESSNLIVGARSFNRRSLHHIGGGFNPYEQAISIIGKTLAAFDEDNLIPCYGFGDASTHDQDVCSFYPDERFCNGFEEVLSRYREVVPHLKLAGPTSFAHPSSKWP